MFRPTVNTALVEALSLHELHEISGTSAHDA